MAFLEWIIALLKNPWLWVVLAGIGMFAWGSISKMVRKVPVINKRTSFIVLTLGLAALFFGVFGMIGYGSVSSVPSGIIASQITTAFATDIDGSVAVSTTQENVVDVRMTDAQANETATFEELSTGVIQFTRSTSDAKAVSMPVRAYVPADYLNQNGSDQTTLYHLVERDSLSVPEVYINCGASSAAATTASPKEITAMPFGEGVSVAYCGVLVEIDEEGHDAMNQYESLPVVIDFGGETYTFNFYRMD